MPHEQALAIRDDVAFFQAVRSVLAKRASAAGLRKPDISILSDKFLADVRGLPHRNLAVETLAQQDGTAKIELADTLRLARDQPLVVRLAFA